jgi:hypothetical protein
MLPLLDARQLLDLAKYHAIVGNPGVDHTDVPLSLLALAVLNFFRGENSEPIEMGQIMPHLAGPELDIDEVFENFQTWKQTIVKEQCPSPQA